MGAVPLRFAIFVMALVGWVASASTVVTAQTAVRFLLDWRIEGPAAPFLLALDRGYFKAEGLDVTIEPGTGSVEPIARVGSGAYEAGLGDINVLIRTWDQNAASAPKAVFMLHNKAAYAVIARKSRGISKVEELEGKRIGAPQSDGSFAQWPVFLKMTGLDGSKIRLENVGFPVREPMLASGEVDAVTGFPFTSGIALRERGVPAEDIQTLLMADYGLKLYGTALVVNQKFAAEKPEAVRGLIRGVLRGLKEAIDQPNAAVNAVLSRNPLLRREVEIERLRLLLQEFVLTPEIRDLGLGAVDMTRLDEAIDQLGASFPLRNKPKAADVFDASYLPERSERRAD